MRILRFVKSASREANTLAAVALAALLGKVGFLNDIPEAFSGAYELGVVSEAVLVSLVSSYVFYLLVVHAKETSDRAILGPFVRKHAGIVVSRCKLQLEELSKASKVSLALSTVTSTAVSEAFSHIDPRSSAPMILLETPLLHANWIQYFDEHAKVSKESIRKLFDQLPFLDVEFVRILTEIDDCHHVNHLSYQAPKDLRNPDLGAWANAFYKYCAFCRELEELLVGRQP